MFEHCSAFQISGQMKCLPWDRTNLLEVAGSSFCSNRTDQERTQNLHVKMSLSLTCKERWLVSPFSEHQNQLQKNWNRLPTIKRFSLCAHTDVRTSTFTSVSLTFDFRTLANVELCATSRAFVLVLKIPSCCFSSLISKLGLDPDIKCGCTWHFR